MQRHAQESACRLSSICGVALFARPSFASALDPAAPQLHGVALFASLSFDDFTAHAFHTMRKCVYGQLSCAVNQNTSSGQVEAMSSCCVWLSCAQIHGQVLPAQQTLQALPSIHTH